MGFCLNLWCFEGLLVHVFTSLNHEEARLAKSEKWDSFCVAVFLKGDKKVRSIQVLRHSGNA
jgi:hypothetical protein